MQKVLSLISFVLVRLILAYSTYQACLKTCPHCKSPSQIDGAAWCLTTRPGKLSRLQFKHFFNELPTPQFLLPPSHRNYRTLEFDIAMSQFPRIFEKDSISWIRWSCDDCDGGEGDENRGRKNQTDVFDFFDAIFVTHREFSMIAMREGGVCGWLGDKNRDWKKSKWRFQFFQWWFPSPHFPHQQFWEFKILRTVWRRRNIANSMVLRLQ